MPKTTRIRSDGAIYRGQMSQGKPQGVGIVINSKETMFCLWDKGKPQVDKGFIRRIRQEKDDVIGLKESNGVACPYSQIWELVHPTATGKFLFRVDFSDANQPKIKCYIRGEEWVIALEMHLLTGLKSLSVMNKKK